MINKAICISTVRKNSQSVKKKNLLKIQGKPLFMHNIDYALNSKFISSVHITTDINISNKILTKKKIGYIKRPHQLCTNKASHFLTIKHAINSIEKQDIEFDIIVVVLGNSFGAKTKDLDEGLKKLINNKKLDSVISVAKYNMYNPIRAFKKDKKKLLTNFFETKTIEKKIKNSTNINTKDAFNDVYFFNGSFWIIRKEIFLKNSGIPPFRFLGKNIGFIEQDPKFVEIDDKWQKKLFE